MKKKRRIGLLLLSSIFLGGYVLSRNNVVPQSILCEDVEALSDDETQKQRVCNTYGMPKLLATQCYMFYK